MHMLQKQFVTNIISMLTCANGVVNSCYGFGAMGAAGWNALFADSGAPSRCERLCFFLSMLVSYYMAGLCDLTRRESALQ